MILADVQPFFTFWISTQVFKMSRTDEIFKIFGPKLNKGDPAMLKYVNENIVTNLLIKYGWFCGLNPDKKQF